MTRLAFSLALAAFTMIAGPGSATAEPIRWSYSGIGGNYEFQPAGQGFYLSMSTSDRTVETALGQSWRIDAFDGMGPETPVRPGAQGRALLPLSVIDIASGEEDEILLPHFGRVNDSGALFVTADPSFTAKLTLGGYDYNFKAVNAYIYATVTEANPAVATPEPATLALAGMGLTGVAIARRVRRGKPAN